MIGLGITKAGIFSIVGRPNVGKSVLTNRLTGRKIAIVSKKPQTTRTRITGVRNDGDCQLVFLDTPGLHKPKTRLGDHMVHIVHETVSSVDAAILLVEPVARIGAPEQLLIDRIKELRMPAILAVNKIDTVRKDALLSVMATYAAAHEFGAIVPISALDGTGVDELVAELKTHCVDSPQFYPDGMITDQPEKQLIAEIIREKLLELLEEEVPHGIAIEIEQLDERDSDICDVAAVIYCERQSHKGIVIGKRGALLKKVGERARLELEEMFGMKVFLQLWVKVKEDWRNSPNAIRNFGLDRSRE